jgi:hypothetical protein
MSTAQVSTVKLKRFHTEGHDGLNLYAVSTADAIAEAFANRDNQVYFGKGAITLKEGGWKRQQEHKDPAPTDIASTTAGC